MPSPPMGRVSTEPFLAGLWLYQNILSSVSHVKSEGKETKIILSKVLFLRLCFESAKLYVATILQSRDRITQTDSMPSIDVQELYSQ